MSYIQLDKCTVLNNSDQKNTVTSKAFNVTRNDTIQQIAYALLCTISESFDFKKSRLNSRSEVTQGH